MGSLLQNIKSSSPLDLAPPHILAQGGRSVLNQLSHLITLSFEKGKVPKEWKHAINKPLLKTTQLDPAAPANYRPISLLPILGKIAEKHTNSVISHFLEDNSIIHQTQIGF